MKSMKFINNQVQIKGKLKNETVWASYLTDVKLPQRTIFYLDMNHIPAKKVIWDFGDNTKNVIITDRKKDPLEEISHYYREKNCQNMKTLSVQASVCTEGLVYTSQKFSIEFDETKVLNYVDPIVFKEQIQQYYDTGNLSDELAISINQIATRFSYRPNWINYPCREELVGEALIKMLQALRDKKFDPEKGNAFSYFTKITYHAFCHKIKLEKKNRLAIDEYQDFVYNTMMSETNSMTPKFYEESNDL